MAARVWTYGALVLGGLGGLLAARLLLLLLAARPDNPSVAGVLWATTPLVAPLAFLNAGQPRFGAVLDLAALLLLAVVVVLTGVGVTVRKRYAAHPQKTASVPEKAKS